jgi:hypothetical protein
MFLHGIFFFFDFFCKKNTTIGPKHI